MDQYKKKKGDKGMPQFLGIFIEDEHKAKQRLDIQIKGYVEQLLQIYADDQLLQSKLRLLSNYRHYPPTLHITSLFIGGNASQKQTKYYQQFQNDLPQNIVIHGFVFNPTKIITAICSHNDYEIPIANQFPHMTTLLGTWKPFLSNELLIQLFSENCPLEKEYQKFFDKNEEDKYWKEKVMVGNKDEEVYIMRLKDKLIFEGRTKQH